MLRSTHSFSVSHPIPDSQTASEVLEALHRHEITFELQPLVTHWCEVPHDEILEQRKITAPCPLDYFSLGKAKVWLATEEIPVVPFLGSRGVHTLKFPIVVENRDDGAIFTAYAGAGVVVHARWEVTREQGAGAGARYQLAEHVQLECSSLLMPFVRGSAESAHSKLPKDLIEKVRKLQAAGENRKSHA